MAKHENKKWNLIKKSCLVLLSVFIVFISASCTTTRNLRFEDADRKVENREFLAAAQMLNTPPGRNSLYRERDQVLRHLDVGMLYHLAERPKESIFHFNEAERLIEENFTRSITNAAASFLINDYMLEYFGEAFEDIYLNIFKAINFLRLNNFDGAFVEVRRLTNKLNLLEDRYRQLARSMNSAEDARGNVRPGRSEFNNSALARYFGVMLYRADNRWDSAAIDHAQIKMAFRDQPNVYNFPMPQNLDKMLERTNLARINIVGFAGRSPIKTAVTLRITTLDNLILISQEREESGRMVLTDLTPIPFPRITGGYNFTAQIPLMTERPSRVARIHVRINDEPAGDLELIEKLDRVAMETFKLNQGMILTRTVIRTVTRGIATRQARTRANAAAASSGSGLAQALAFFGGIAATVAVDATERADLRSARYFPGQAYVGEFWVEPGEHTVTVDFYDSAGRLLYRRFFPAGNFTAGGLHLLTAYNLQ